MQNLHHKNMRSRINKLIRAATLLCVAAYLSACNNASQLDRPNIVIIFLDDSGWADFSPFGEDHIQTPQVATLATEGCTFSNFYVPQAICSASRSALLSGCYPGRTKVFGAHGPNQRGLDTLYQTMGEVFQSAGYATAVFGKWHIGDQPDTRPQNRGFDESAGLMYSNDMWKHHPENPEYWGKYPLQFWENGAVKIEEVTRADQKNLTKWYTEYAVDFIRRHRDVPFLLYVPHSMPHVPIYCSEEFEGRSGAGLYGDVILELDWSVGEINNALKANDIEDNTIMVFSSDNGPWTSYGHHAGFTPFREAKATSFDGGVRSPCIIKYPAVIQANTRSDRTFFSIDLLPSLCYIAGAALPENIIDGMNVWDLITDVEGVENPHAYYAISTGARLEGIMSGNGKWKLHIPHPYRTLVEAGTDGAAGKYVTAQIDTALFDMEHDPYESTNVLKQRPDIAEQLIRYASDHKNRFYRE
jgi:arylsulfatase A-like enzyme